MQMFYLESDVAVDGPRVKGSFRTWQPATRVQKPANFWAHLRPVAPGECVEEGPGATHVRVLLALARTCPSSNDAGKVAVFIRGVLGVSLLSYHAVAASLMTFIVVQTTCRLELFTLPFFLMFYVSCEVFGLCCWFF